MTIRKPERNGPVLGRSCLAAVLITALTALDTITRGQAKGGGGPRRAN